MYIICYFETIELIYKTINNNSRTNEKKLEYYEKYEFTSYRLNNKTFNLSIHIRELVIKISIDYIIYKLETNTITYS